MHEENLTYSTDIVNSTSENPYYLFYSYITNLTGIGRDTDIVVFGCVSNCQNSISDS